MSKTNSELIKEFLDKGGIIQKLEPITPIISKNVSKANTPTVLKTLSEGELLYGKTSKKRKKKADNIDYSVIPDHIKKLIGKSDS